MAIDTVLIIARDWLQNVPPVTQPPASTQRDGNGRVCAFFFSEGNSADHLSLVVDPVTGSNMPN